MRYRSKTISLALVLAAFILGGCGEIAAVLGGNRAPLITGLYAESGSVPAGSTIDVQCNAVDIDGDTVNYRWSANAGVFAGSGAAVQWTAPDSTGSYTVACTVVDSHGAAIAAQVTVQVTEAEPEEPVSTNQAPVIHSMSADPSIVCPGERSTITATVSDPEGDPITYSWKASGGHITGEGTSATWTAPDAGGTYVITVSVADEHGNVSRRGIRVGESKGSSGGGGGG